MKIEVHTYGVESDKMIRQLIHRKINFALDRFKERIEQVIVKLEDESRGSNAFDGRCKIETRFQPKGHVHVTGHGSTPEETVVQAITKLENAILNDIERNRSSSRIRHEKSKRQFLSSLENDPNDGGLAEKL